MCESETDRAEPAIVFKGIGFAYPGHSPALENISLRVEPGERLAIIGPNGGGKSTLLKLLMGELTPRSGQIRVFGLSTQEARSRRLIGYVPQRSAAERGFPVSVRQAVTMGATIGLSPLARTPQRIKDTVAACLDQVGLTDLAERPVGELSGGQFQRMLLARALAVEPKILVLDEPTVGVDAAGQEQLAAVLDRLHRETKLTMLIVSHDVRAIAGSPKKGAGARPFCDRVACLRRTLHFHDSPQGITPQVLAHVFEHDLSAVFGDVHVEAHAAADCEDPAHLHTHHHDHHGACSDDHSTHGSGEGDR
ncbi:MAG: metal ABC transporter ATP-binding protein [Phycisphaerales bacterium JB050]